MSKQTSKPERHTYPVAYRWHDGVKLQEWCTVASGPDEATALSRFLREHRSVLEAWVIKDEKEAA